MKKKKLRMKKFALNEFQLDSLVSPLFVFIIGLFCFYYRTQQVQLNNALSDPVELKFGVPQRSILGPMLFILYVNNLHSFMRNGHSVQYADDTTLMYTAQTLQELEINSFQSTNICMQFFEELNLKTNLNKSKLIYFNIGIQNSFETPSVFLNDNPIEEVEHFNFLGISVDRKLTWTFHVEHVCNKVSSGIFFLRNLVSYCSKDVLKMAYYGIIHSHLKYGTCLWGNCAKTKTDRIFILQKYAIRVLANLKNRGSCRKVFQQLEISTFPSLYIYETILFSLNKRNLVLGSDVHSYNTRSVNNYRIDNHRLEILKNYLHRQEYYYFINCPIKYKI